MNSIDPRILRRFLWSFPVLGGVAALAIHFFGDLPDALRWPARIVIWGCVPLAIWRFPGDSRAVVEWFAPILRGWWTALQKPLEAPIWRRLELVAAVLLVVVGTWHAVAVGRDMSWCSLRTDEITSIARYSGRGPIVTATQYRRANNHIFFNLLNSLTPGAGSFHPLRARMWSFISIAALLAGSLIYFWSRGQYAAGSLMFSVTALNATHLMLALEARAYGLVALFGFLCAVAFVRHRREWDDASLAWLCVLTALGTYAVPYFVVFGGMLILALYLERPTTGRFLAGVWTLCGIVVLYLPVAADLRVVADAYDEDYGFTFQDIEAAFGVLIYVIPGGVRGASLAAAVAGAALFFFVCLLPPVTRDRRARSGLLVAAACLGFITFCYVLATPPRRVAAFLAAPFMFGLIVAGQAAASRRPFRSVATAAAPLVCLAATLFAVSVAQAYKFEPRQKWREFGRAVHLLFPEGTRVWFDMDYNNNTAYLGGRYPAMKEGSPMPVEELAEGMAILHDANYNRRTELKRVTAGELPPGVESLVFELAGGESRLWFMPCAAPFDVQASGETGRSGEPAAFYAAESARTGSAHGVIVFRDGGWKRPGAVVRDVSGRIEKLPERDMAVEGAALLIRMPTGAVSLEIFDREDSVGHGAPPVRVISTGKL